MTGSKPPPDRRRTALVVRLVLLGIVIILAGTIAVKRDTDAVSPARAAERAGPAALAAARTVVPAVFSYNWRSLETSRTAASTLTADGFTQRYLSVFDETIARPAVEQRLVQTATVRNAGLVEATATTARVLMLADFTASREATGQTTNAPGLLILTMVAGPSGWLLVELTPMP